MRKHQLATHINAFGQVQNQVSDLLCACDADISNWPSGSWSVAYLHMTGQPSVVFLVF